MPIITQAATRRQFVAGSLASAISISTASRVLAQAEPYPSRPVKLTLGYAAGGTADVMGRIMADRLRTSLKQSFIVDNRPGASGNIAATQVARAVADGYTLLLGNTAEMAVNRHIMKEPGFNAETDFQPVARLFDVPLVLVVASRSPYQSVADLVNAARQAPRTVSFASAGSGSPGHLAGEALAEKTSAPMTHVAYKGAAPALTDILGGHVSCYFSGLTAAREHIRSGSLRVLAVSSQKRSRFISGAPTVAESLRTDFNFSLWGGLFAPARTPVEIIVLLNQHVNAALANESVQAALANEGSESVANSPDEFRDFVRRESRRYEKLIKDINYVPQ